MIRCVSGHSFSAAPMIVASPSLAAWTTAAAAPSPNIAVATTAAGSSLSRRIEIEQVSTVTNSQRAARVGRGQARRRRKAVDPAGAAEPEHRHAADVVAQAEPRADARFEAWRGDAGRRDGDDAVDLVRRQPGLLDRGRGGLDEQLLGGLQIDRIAVVPAVAVLVPIVRERRCGAWRSRHCRTRPTAGRTGLSCPRMPGERVPSLPADSMRCGGTAVASERRLQGCMSNL